MPEPKPPDVSIEECIHAANDNRFVNHATYVAALAELAKLKADAARWRAAGRKLEQQMAENREACRLLDEPRKEPSDGIYS